MGRVALCAKSDAVEWALYLKERAKAISLRQWL